MATETSTAPERALLERIRSKRREIDRFLKAAVPRNSRLTNTTILCGAISAALTAGPALGGQTFTAWLTKAFGLTVPAWQLLCLAAAVCSTAATVATAMAKSDETSAKLLQAQACDAKLEGLETLLEIGKVDMAEASQQYARALTEIPFI